MKTNAEILKNYIQNNLNDLYSTPIAIVTILTTRIVCSLYRLKAARDKIILTQLGFKPIATYA
jgi:hypothetical protein